MQTQRELALKMARKLGLLRTREAISKGITTATLARLVDSGELERIERGLYKLPQAAITEHHTLALVSKKVDNAVICLLSALSFHGLTTQLPAQVWLGLLSNRKPPQLDYPPLVIVYMSPETLAYGAQTHILEKVPVQITSPAKTVADCFKYRSRVGLDVAIEALRDYWEERKGTTEELWEASKICRVSNIIQPYWEAIIG